MGPSGPGLAVLILCLGLVFRAQATSELVGLSFNSSASQNYINLVNAKTGAISSSLPFDQYLYTTSTTYDPKNGLYWVFTMNVSGMFANSVNVNTFQSISTMPLSAVSQLYCAQYDTSSGYLYALSQNESMILVLGKLNLQSGSWSPLHEFPSNWQFNYFGSAFDPLAGVYTVLFNTPGGQMLYSWSAARDSQLYSIQLPTRSAVSLAFGTVLVLLQTNATAVLGRQSISSAGSSRLIAPLPSPFRAFQYASTANSASGTFYLVMRPVSKLSPVLVSVTTSSGAVSAVPLSSTYLAFMQDVS